MLIKKLLIIIVMLATGEGYVYGQQTGTSLAGKWEITRVDARLYTQQTDSLLSISTLVTTADIAGINAAVPVEMSFDQLQCIFRTLHAQEQGAYKLTKDNKLLYTSTANVPPGIPVQSVSPVVYEYWLKQDDTLTLELPAAYYVDAQRGLAVKLNCTCYYRKQK